MRHREIKLSILLANKNHNFVYKLWKVNGELVSDYTSSGQGPQHNCPSASCKFRGLQAICTSDQLAANVGGYHNTLQVRYFTTATHRTQESTNN